MNLGEWLRGNISADCVSGGSLDEAVEAGLNFIERLARKASPYSAEIVWPLEEFMKEEGLTGKDEARSRFIELYRKANSLQGRYEEVGLYFNYLDSLDADNEDGKTVRLGYRFWLLLKYNGFLGRRLKDELR